MILSKSAEAIDLNKLIDRHLTENEIDKILFIVPTNRRARRLALELSAASAAKAVQGVKALTLQGLAAALAQRSANTGALIPEEAAVILMRGCFQQLEPIKYFANYKDHIPEGILRVLHQLFVEWKRNLLAPDDVVKQISETAREYEVEKLKEVIELYRLYVQKLKAHGFYESGDIFDNVLSLDKNFASAFRDHYPGIRTIIVQGYSEFSPPEVLLLHLCSLVKDVQLYVDIDYSEKNPAMFGHLLSYIENFNQLNFVTAPDSREDLSPEHISLLRARLFALQSGAPKQPKGIAMERIAAGSREEEVLIIAKKIKLLIREKNINPQNICIVSNLISEYSSLIRNILPAAGISVNITDREVLSTAPVVTALLNYVEIVSSNWYHKTLFRAVSSGFIPLKHCTYPELKIVAAKYRIIAGIDKWEQLDALTADEDDDDDIVGIAARCKKEIDRIKNELAPFAVDMTPDAFYAEFNRCIHSFDIHRKINAENLEGHSKVIAAIKGLLKTTKEICEFSNLEGGKDTAYPLSYYLDEIQNTLRYTRYAVPAPQFDSVLVTTPEEIRGFKFDYLFMAGMYDGNFPSRYRKELFAPEALAHDEKRYIADQQYSFYQTLCAARRNIFLSCPRFDNETALYPSNFLSALQKVFIINESDTADLKYRAVSRRELFAMLHPHILRSDTIAELRDHLPADSARLLELTDIDAARRSQNSAADDHNGIINLNSLNSDSARLLTTFSAKEFSVSQLETYAQCPFKFFMRRVLTAQEAAEVEEEVTASEYGNLIHQIFFEFYQQLDAKNGLASLSNAERMSTLNHLFDIAERIINDTIPGQTLTEWERESILGIAGRREHSILYKFFQAELENEFIPAMFETGFGRLPQEAQVGAGSLSSETILLNGIALRGKIDRIDIDPDNEHFNVVDYKSSFNTTKYAKKNFENGLQLQLPVYLFAAQEILKKRYSNEPAPRPLLPLIFSFRYRKDEFGFKNVILTKTEIKNNTREQLSALIQSAIDNAGEKISSYVEKMTRGKFNLTELDKATRDKLVCGYCEYKYACRIADRIESGAQSADGDAETVDSD